MNRRSLMTAALVSPIVAVGAAAPVMAVETDPHPHWLAEWLVQNRDYGASLTSDGDETPASQAAWNRKEALAKMICATPAATLTGVAAKLQWLLTDAEGDFARDEYEAAITSAVDDIAGIDMAEARALVA